MAAASNVVRMKTFNAMSEIKARLYSLGGKNREREMGSLKLNNIADQTGKASGGRGKRGKSMRTGLDALDAMKRLRPKEAQRTESRSDRRLPQIAHLGRGVAGACQEHKECKYTTFISSGQAYQHDLLFVISICGDFRRRYVYHNKGVPNRGRVSLSYIPVENLR
jgi:hypothetical protein